MAASPRSKFVVLGVVLAGLVAVLALLPMLFGGTIAKRAKQAANDALTAQIDWSDAGLSLFGDFPNLTLTLDDFTAVGTGPFVADTLAAVGELRVVVDLSSAVRSVMGSSAPIVVRAVQLDEPRLRLIALEDGRANWQIVKDAATSSHAGEPLSISLKRLTIEDGELHYDDRAGKLRADAFGIDQTLSGDFAAAATDIKTTLEIDKTTLRFAGITYLNEVAVKLVADVAADLAAKRYTVAKGTSLRLNALQLDASGTAAQTGEDLDLDLAFAAPTTDFKNILSLVPVVYTHDFDKVQTTGTLAVRGEVKGRYGKTAFPAFALDARVADGTFKYPDLPLPAREIGLDLAIRNAGGSADNTVINLRRLHLLLGSNPVDASLVLRTPISDPDVDARVRGTVDLADVRRTVKLDDLQDLAGIITADAALKTRLSWVDNAQYDRVAASGSIDVRNVSIAADAGRKPVTITEASLRLAPQRAELRSFSGRIGSSDVRASGQLDNVVGYLLRDDDLTGRATVQSTRFVVDEWQSDSASGIIPVPPKLDLTLAAVIGTLAYGKITMTDARGTLRVKDQRITLDGFTLNTMGGAVAMNGFYETTVPTKPTFDFGMKVQTLDIPTAFATLTTVQRLVPMAKYMQGSFSADFRLNGPLGENLVPVIQQLTGQGTVQTTQVAVINFPPFAKAASATKVALLNNPTLRAINSAFEVKDGRFRLKPFTVGIGTTTMVVSGSNGFDQTLDYNLQLKLPRALMGEANDVLNGLVSKAQSRGLNLVAAPEIALGITLRGDITNPTIGTDVGAATGSLAEGVGNAAQEAVETRVTAAVDSARLRADAARANAVQEAERKAEQLRAEARELADKIRAESAERADSLVAKAGSNPLRKVAAEAAAKKLREEGETRAGQVVREADAQAEALLSAARAGGN